MNTSEKSLLTMTELASYLKCTERHIQKQMKHGLPCLRPGDRMVRFDLDAVNAWLARNSSRVSAQQAV